MHLIGEHQIPLPAEEAGKVSSGFCFGKRGTQNMVNFQIQKTQARFIMATSITNSFHIFQYMLPRIGRSTQYFFDIIYACTVCKVLDNENLPSENISFQKAVEVVSWVIYWWGLQGTCKYEQVPNRIFFLMKYNIRERIKCGVRQ